MERVGPGAIGGGVIGLSPGAADGPTNCLTALLPGPSGQEGSG